ncbi:uncharacterized protein LOC101746725 [Bombyx mori]|uniref:ZBR-type domain-containing protein n=1 Tax=Bombyx mori TaxID=7091 RepID=A0A8R1WJB2_BOMMO|nr:uncharacterized protein LOC101746725 [Bombyx mori]
MESSTLLANTMEIPSNYEKSTQPAIFIDISLCKNEESGYHTLTPGSIEASNLSSDYFEQSILANNKRITGQIRYITPETNQCNRPSVILNDITGTPLPRRGLKRSYQDIETLELPYSPIPTPTSLIAGQIRNLYVNENKENSSRSLNAINIDRANNLTKHLLQGHESASYPITPVKRNCKTNPCRKSAKKLNFVTHSLSCEMRELQQVNRPRALVEAVKTVLFKPNNDIIQRLYEGNVIPPIATILNYLSNEDINNFILVSATWAEVWTSVSDSERKVAYEQYLKNAKENQENGQKIVHKNIERKNTFSAKIGCLREIHNELNNSKIVPTPRSPPGTPKSNRFKKFTKSASLDTRMQLSCVRCSLPAKVTVETSGEEWVECINVLCAYQFCRFCQCERHPDKVCFQYDLNGPSPSKRKKTHYAIGTKKSRKNLRRLL